VEVVVLVVVVVGVMHAEAARETKTNVTPIKARGRTPR
jgi:hypothetical protein